MNFEDMNWTLLKGTIQGRPVLVRYRQFPSNFEKARFPVRLNVFWRMVESALTGLPLEAESIRLSEFEDLVVKAVEHDQQSVLSVVLTGDSQREFVFHTHDVDDFLERLSEMPQQTSPYPIEISSFVDPDWIYDDKVTTVAVKESELH